MVPQERTATSDTFLPGNQCNVYRMNRRHFVFSLPLLALASCAQARSASLIKVVGGLDHPWGMAFLPDSSILVTERDGRLRRVLDRKLLHAISGTPKVDAQGQGGLLGIALDPDFASNRLIYLSFAEAREGGSATAVFRGQLSPDATRLEDGKVIFRQNIAYDGGQHFGSRLVFDRSGHLFVTTGDRYKLRDKVQDPATHIGKVLRITREGAPAPGNPNPPGWAPEVWSLGHRNLQGATLHPETGELWTTEHGPRGGDEVNVPEAGRNYGWPVISYGREYSYLQIGEGTRRDGMEQPVHYWDPSIAPSGMTFLTSDVYPDWKGSLFVGALAGTHVSRLKLAGRKVIGEEKLFQDVARFRDVVQGPDGRLYVLTDEGAPDGSIYVVAAPGEVTASP
jgi:aldose sugar dehydrogenase